MHLFVGSTNPVKINAVTIAASEQWPEVKVEGLAVDSQVSEQPTSDTETRTGAINRAKNALKQGLGQLKPSPHDQLECLGVGLEGGVVFEKNGEVWSTVWAAVVDQMGQVFLSGGARFKVAPIVADQLKQGKEMGPVLSKLFEGRNIRQQEGMIGIITKKFVDRTEEYSGIAKLALGLWYGRSWQQDIPESNKL